MADLDGVAVEQDGEGTVSVAFADCESLAVAARHHAATLTAEGSVSIRMRTLSMATARMAWSLSQTICPRSENQNRRMIRSLRCLSRKSSSLAWSLLMPLIEAWAGQ